MYLLILTKLNLINIIYKRTNLLLFCLNTQLYKRLLVLNRLIPSFFEIENPVKFRFLLLPMKQKAAENNFTDYWLHTD